MLHLHHADQLDPLLDALGDLLCTTPADPFEPELVVVPAAGMRDAVTVGLGRRLGVSAPGAADGVVANVDYVFPARFMARALGSAGRGDDEVEGDPWRLPRLTWAVLDVLALDPHNELQVPGRTDGEQWALARHIADLFDRYATQRPRLLQMWAEGIAGDGVLLPDGSPAPLDSAHRWQPRLWRAVRAHVGRPSPPEQLPQLLHQLRTGQVEPALPSRVSVFGIGAIAPAMLTVLRAVAHVREVHVFLRHPSLVAWQSSGNRLAGSLSPRSPLDVTVHTQHPLLGSWGRPSLETRALVGGADDIADLPYVVAESTAPATLLGALQQGIRLDRPPARQADLDAADGSLQVHACHGEVRQLEALRDALGHAFIADPTLAPHDVLVLCPDLERFAPLVEAVFQRGDLPVPVRIGDRSLSTDDPLIGALHAVLAVVSGRASLSEVLALVQFEPVRHRFGWSIEHVEQLAAWCATLGTRWGLSPHHRTGWGLPADLATGTWQSTIDSLLAGVAFAAPTPRVVLGEVAPFDDIGNDDLSLVGTVAELLARLGRVHADVQQPRVIADWVELLHRVVDEFTAVESDQAWRPQAVHRDIDAMREASLHAASGAASSVLLPFSDLRALLSDGLQRGSGRLSLRSGAVTVSSLVPQHGVPARVVCLLGLDESTGRAGTFDGDDLLGVHPCVGERHPRFEARQVLLDAVLAARHRLLITCNGADITTNDDTPFVVPLVELLDVVGQLVELRQGSPVVIRHPRHGFNERALVPGVLCAGSSSAYTFDRTMLVAATARRAAMQADPDASATTSPWSLPPATFDSVDLADLCEVVANPATAYLRRRLDVGLPRDSDAVDDGLSISLDPLVESRLGRELLDARRLGGSVEQWEAAARLDGSLPPRSLGDAAFTAVALEVGALEAKANGWAVPLVGSSSVRVDLPLDVDIDGVVRRVMLRGDITGVAHGPQESTVVHVRFTRPRPSFRLALALQLAAAQLAEPDRDWVGVVVHRGERDAPQGTRLRLRGTGSLRLERARALLGTAVQLLAWAQRDAVPFLDRTSEALSRGAIAAAFVALDTDLRDAEASLLWPEVTVESLLRDPVLSTDPVPVAVSAPPTGPKGHLPGSRAIGVATWVWTEYLATVEAITDDADDANDTDDDNDNDNGNDTAPIAGVDQ